MAETKMTPEVKAQGLEAIRIMLDERTCEITWLRGMKDRDGGAGWMVTDPTNGREIVIKVHGGAVHEKLPV